MNTKAPIDFSTGDDLSDLFGTPSAAPRELPAGDDFARIRAHGTGEVPVAPVFQVPCSKCRGTGRFISYAGRNCGPCFTCKGVGHFERKQSAAKLAANREKAAQRKADAAAENIESFKKEFPAQFAWIERTARQEQTATNVSFLNMVRELPERIRKYGSLSDNTMAMIGRGIARDAERVAAVAVDVDASKIAEAFAKAAAAGLEKIGLYFKGLVFMPAKKHPGVIYVKAGKSYGATYYGKIENGRFIPARDCPEDIKARVVIVAADPAAAAQAHGYETGVCCICDRKLTNKESVELGIGPICGKRFDWTPGGLLRKVSEVL